MKTKILNISIIFILILAIMPTFNVLARTPQKGDVIWFGTWNNRPLEWIVLERTDSDLFLLSWRILEDRQWHTSTPRPHWYNSDIRNYLNDTTPNGFMGKVFTEAEQSAIAITFIDDSIVDKSYDKVFFLSEAETQNRDYGLVNPNVNWFPLPVALYPAKNLAGMNYNWWLRSPTTATGAYSWVQAVNGDGSIMDTIPVTSSNIGIRPAMRVDLPGVTGVTILDNMANVDFITYGNACVIVAFFDECKYLGGLIQPCDISGRVENIVIPQNATKIQAFMWENTSTMCPIGEIVNEFI